MGENGTVTITNIKKGTGINDDRLSALSEGGAGSTTETRDFFIDSVGGYDAGYTSVTTELEFITSSRGGDFNDPGPPVELQSGDTITVGMGVSPFFDDTNAPRQLLQDGQCLETLGANVSFVSSSLVDSPDWTSYHTHGITVKFEILPSSASGGAISPSVFYAANDGGLNSDMDNYDTEITETYTNIRVGPDVKLSTSPNPSDINQSVSYNVDYYDPNGDISNPEFDFYTDESDTVFDTTTDSGTPVSKTFNVGGTFSEEVRVYENGDRSGSPDLTDSVSHEVGDGTSQ